MKRSLEILKRYFGYDAFRPGQQAVVEELLAGHDVLAVMPTGAGKSICYQVPALCMEGITLVVSPLISLMKDQVENLIHAGVPAAYLNSSLTERQFALALSRAKEGRYKIIYVAPERLETAGFLSFARQANISFLAVDEAHCVSQWGQDFRPSYLNIPAFVAQLHHRPVVAAFTATATPEVREDIAVQLALQNPYELVTGFDRPNLFWEVSQPRSKKEGLLDFLRHRKKESGIVYCATRKNVEEICQFLQERGFPATRYHAGLDNEERRRNQEEFVYGEHSIMVATNAFGMGIDKPDVRFVVHYTMCDSLESYYQEAGRAGRDGKRAYALLLASEDDPQRIVRRYEQEFPPLEQVKDIYEEICSYLQIAIGDGAQTSHLFNIFEFCARNHRYEGTVESAIKLLQLNGYITLTDAQENPARVMFMVSRDELYRIRVNRNELDPFIRVLLRLYNGIFNDFRPINESEIATWSGYSVERVRELLKRLWQLRVIRYIPSNRSPILYLHEERLPREDLYIAPETYRRRKELIEERFEQMLHYAQNEEQCRSTVLDHYFGGKSDIACGICDICLRKRREEKARRGETQADEATLREQIIATLQANPTEPHALLQRLKASPERASELLRQLLEEGLITQSGEGLLKISDL